MRSLVLAVLAVSPAVFAQTRGFARTGASVRRAAGPLARGSASGPVQSGGVAGLAPSAGVIPVSGLFLGYYPGYGPGYANGYVDVPPDTGVPAPYAATPQAGNVPPPAYYGADPGGQGYPSVLINPNYTPETAHPVMHDYSYLSPSDGDDAAAAQPPAAPSVYFLIAMKDHTIYPAIAYWVQNGTLNYITQQGVRREVPLTQVDREFSTQLNKERNIDFALPEVSTN